MFLSRTGTCELHTLVLCVEGTIPTKESGADCSHAQVVCESLSESSSQQFSIGLDWRLLVMIGDQFMKRCGSNSAASNAPM